jgi:predicted phosphodiesterase
VPLGLVRTSTGTTRHSRRSPRRSSAKASSGSCLTLRAFHGSPFSYDDALLPDTPDAVAEQRWGGSGVDVLAGGHTHRQWARIVDGALYVNPGAVMSEVAEFAIVTGGSVEFRRVEWQSAS